MRRIVLLFSLFIFTGVLNNSLAQSSPFRGRIASNINDTFFIAQVSFASLPDVSDLSTSHGQFVASSGSDTSSIIGMVASEAPEAPESSQSNDPSDDDQWAKQQVEEDGFTVPFVISEFQPIRVISRFHDFQEELVSVHLAYPLKPPRVKPLRV